MDNIYKVLVRPVVTEKSVKAQDLRKYTFLVSPDANKIDIQNAVSTIYWVEVESVKMIPVRKKVRMLGKSKIMTKRQAGKKAIITLKDGQSMDVLNLSKEKKKPVKKDTKTATKK